MGLDAKLLFFTEQLKVLKIAKRAYHEKNNTFIEEIIDSLGQDRLKL